MHKDDRNNLYANNTDLELLNMWNRFSYQQENRFYIFAEIMRRNLADRLTEITQKVNKDEFICFKMRTGFFPLGGCSSLFEMTINMLFFLIIPFSFIVLTSKYHFFIIQYNYFRASGFQVFVFSFAVIVAILYFLEFFGSHFIILTNKSIVFYKRIFWFIKIPIKKIKFQDTYFFNSYHTITGLQFTKHDGPPNFTILFTLYYIDKSVKLRNILLLLKKFTLFIEWFNLLTTLNHNSKSYFLPIKIYSEINNDVFNYKSNDIRDFFDICHDKCEQILKYAKKNSNINFCLFYNLISKKKYNISYINKNSIKYLHSIFYSENVISLFNIFSMTTNNKYLLVLTDSRIVIISKYTYNITYSYDLSDKFLTFKVHNKGIILIYKGLMVYYILWKNINVPLVDILAYLNVESS
jgi:hypothetical protein